MKLTVNGVSHEIDVPPDVPLLWVLREHLGLTGTRYGCGLGQCGACTVHFNGQPMRSCILPAAALEGAEIRTIEGLGPHPLQEAWLELQVPQCGYCQSGQLMAAASLLETVPEPTDQDIDTIMSNLCRCATYDRIRAGIKLAATRMPKPEPAPGEDNPDDPSAELPAGGEL